MIKKSVGFGGENDPMDVCTIQYLLNCVPTVNGGPTEELPVDGARHGGGFTKMVIAIRRFQARVFQGWSDGRVDPGGQTLQHLRRWNPADPSYGGFVKQGATNVKLSGEGKGGGYGEDQSVKLIKGTPDAMQKGIAAVADATLKAVQAAVKYGPGMDKASGDPHAGSIGKLSGAMQKVVDSTLKTAGGMKDSGIKGGSGVGGGISGAIKTAADMATKAAGGIKGSQAKGGASGGSGGGISGAVKSAADMALKAAGGIKGGQPVKGSTGGGLGGAIKGAVEAALKGMGGIKGEGMKGDGVKGGFTDPFNMKGGGGGVSPGPGNIKGNPGPTVIN